MSSERRFVGLPIGLVGPVDVARLVRELKTLDNEILHQTLQKHAPKLPQTSKLMDELAGMNKLDLLDKEDRARLQQFLEATQTRAPLLHMSFSADPSPAFLEKMIDWLRRNIHPLVLVTIGLQPSIGAGCIVRTTNKYFDFSLSQNFSKNRELLMAKLKTESEAGVPAAMPQPTEAS